MATQLAHWGGATVIGTVRQRGDLEQVNTSAVAHAVALDQPDPAGAIRAHAPHGVDRIIEVAFSDNIDLDAAVAKNQTVIAAYATRADRPGFPFWPMMFDNVTIRLLGSDDFPAAAKQQAAGSSGPHRRVRRRFVVNRDRHPTAPRASSTGPRPRRRRRPRAHPAGNPGLN